MTETETAKDELLATVAYHLSLQGLLFSMDVPNRGRIIGNISKNEEPQMIFGAHKSDECPVTSITLPRQLLYALANSANLRLLIEDEMIKCEEQCEKEGLDIYVPKGVAA